MGFQVGQTALKHGTEYVEQNVGISSISFRAHSNTCISLTDMSTYLRSNTTSTSRTGML
jgi:hypothetical protein